MIAHYISLLAYQGQAAWDLFQDPLGHGERLDLDRLLDPHPNDIWYIQLAALVTGHAAGLALAHDRALAVYGDPRAATRSQVWMLGVMVAFTCLGLWLLLGERD